MSELDVMKDIVKCQKKQFLCWISIVHMGLSFVRLHQTMHCELKHQMQSVVVEHYESVQVIGVCAMVMSINGMIGAYEVPV